MQTAASDNNSSSATGGVSASLNHLPESLRARLSAEELTQLAQLRSTESGTQAEGIEEEEEEKKVEEEPVQVQDGTDSCYDDEVEVIQEAPEEFIKTQENEAKEDSFDLPEELPAVAD